MIHAKDNRSMYVCSRCPYLHTSVELPFVLYMCLTREGKTIFPLTLSHFKQGEIPSFCPYEHEHSILTCNATKKIAKDDQPYYQDDIEPSLGVLSLFLTNSFTHWLFVRNLRWMGWCEMLALKVDSWRKSRKQ